MAIIQEITVINNKTNKEHTLKNTNEFGLTWSLSDATNKIIYVYQKTQDSDSYRKVLSVLIDFSILDTKWK